MTTNNSIPMPLALRHLIESNNRLLENYQAELTAKVLSANEEIMRLLELRVEDGWKIDMSTFSYVKTDQDASPVGE